MGTSVVEHSESNLSVESLIIKNPFLFELLKDQSEELALLAVSVNPKALAAIPEQYQTLEVCKRAILNDMTSFPFIINPSTEICHYALGISSCDLECILDNIEGIIDKPPILKNIILNISSNANLMIYQKKFPVEVWTENLIQEIMCVSGKTLQKANFIIFLLQIGLELTSRIKCCVLCNCWTYVKKIVEFEFNENDAKYYLQNYRSCTEVAFIGEKLYGAVDLTDKEFYKSNNKITALKFAKHITNKMVLITALNSPWIVIDICQKRGLLTAELMINILDVGSHIITKNFDKESVDRIKILQSLKNIKISKEQLKTIKRMCKPIAKYFVVETKTQTDNNESVDNNTPLHRQKRNDGYDILRLDKTNLKKEDYEASVKINGILIHCVPAKERTLELCGMAYGQNKKSIKFFPDEIRNEILNQEETKVRQEEETKVRQEEEMKVRQEEEMKVRQEAEKQLVEKEIKNAKQYYDVLIFEGTKDHVFAVSNWNLEDEMASLLCIYESGVLFKQCNFGYKFYHFCNKIKSVIIPNKGK